MGTSSLQPKTTTLVERLERALIARIEGGETIHLVSPHVDAHRQLGSRREDVDDPSPHCDLTHMLDLVLAAVPHLHQPLDEIVLVDPVSFGHSHWSCGFEVRRHDLENRADRGHDDLRGDGVGRCERGLVVWRRGASRRRVARADAGAGPSSGPLGSPARKASVSQAGKSSTDSGSDKNLRSWTKRSASDAVAVTTRIGPPSSKPESAAITYAVAISGTAITGSAARRARARVDSSPSRGGSERRLTRPG